MNPLRLTSITAILALCASLATAATDFSSISVLEIPYTDTKQTLDQLGKACGKALVKHAHVNLATPKCMAGPKMTPNPLKTARIEVACSAHSKKCVCTIVDCSPYHNGTPWKAAQLSKDGKLSSVKLTASDPAHLVGVEQVLLDHTGKVQDTWPQNVGQEKLWS